MTTKNNFEDSQIEVLGEDLFTNRKRKNTKWFYLLIFILIIVVLAATLLMIYKSANTNTKDDSTNSSSNFNTEISNINSIVSESYINIKEIVINDIPLLIYEPINGKFSLMTGLPPTVDTSIIFICTAAGTRGDNKEILGDFIIDGKQISKGKSKSGFVSILKNQIEIGISLNDSISKHVIEQGGSMFRQYILVKNNIANELNIKGKAIRRALTIKDGYISFYESRSRESLHDFSQALVDSGINYAIYLGGNLYGWYKNRDGYFIEMGNYPTLIPEESSNQNYIVVRSY